MQDPRIRLFSVIILSVVSLIGVAGALSAILWWLICTDRVITNKRSMSSFAWIILLPASLAALITLSGGDGLKYFIELTALLLIASWAYTKRIPGELLDVSVFALGKGIGFDLGLVAELSVSAAEVLADDIAATRIALAQKNQRISPKTLIPVMTSLLIRNLRVAGDRATLLAIRGYHRGGNYSPAFRPGPYDRSAGIGAVVAGLVALLVTYLWAPA